MERKLTKEQLNAKLDALIDEIKEIKELANSAMDAEQCEELRNQIYESDIIDTDTYLQLLVDMTEEELSEVK